jgi:hypothetical protein
MDIRLHYCSYRDTYYDCINIFFTTAPSTCPKRRRGGCLVVYEDVFSSLKVLMLGLADQQDLFGQHDKLLSFYHTV